MPGRAPCRPPSSPVLAGHRRRGVRRPGRVVEGRARAGGRARAPGRRELRQRLLRRRPRHRRRPGRPAAAGRLRRGPARLGEGGRVRGVRRRRWSPGWCWRRRPSWWLVLVGAVAIVAAWFYTGGRSPYGYHGLGEVMVFVFFGLVAVLGTTYVQTGTLPLPGWYAAIGVGALACAILVANNLRDIPTDRDGRQADARGACSATRGPARSTRCCSGRPWSRSSASRCRPAAGRCSAWCSCCRGVPAVRLVLGGASGRDLVPVLQRTGICRAALRRRPVRRPAARHPLTPRRAVLRLGTRRGAWSCAGSRASAGSGSQDRAPQRGRVGGMSLWVPSHQGARWRLVAGADGDHRPASSGGRGPSSSTTASAPRTSHGPSGHGVRRTRRRASAAARRRAAARWTSRDGPADLARAQRADPGADASSTCAASSSSIRRHTATPKQTSSASSGSRRDQRRADVAGGDLLVHRVGLDVLVEVAATPARGRAGGAPGRTCRHGSELVDLERGEVARRPRRAAGGAGRAGSSRCSAPASPRARRRRRRRSAVEAEPRARRRTGWRACRSARPAPYSSNCSSTSATLALPCSRGTANVCGSASLSW